MFWKMCVVGVVVMVAVVTGGHCTAQRRGKEKCTQHTHTRLSHYKYLMYARSVIEVYGGWMNGWLDGMIDGWTSMGCLAA